ncbi:hypothetical protein Vau01_124740 [Virgisporangium aurantiacum]|uniref:Uncharacterized protein n=1 Tax=Virgisporangium aurantiacum TaxID=175570 RepID=A0A8J3ZNK2_9ACTN|nr:hypothetical protein Vau01_124740 [Virgisporangium aurantiacum]
MRFVPSGFRDLRLRMKRTLSLGGSPEIAGLGVRRVECISGNLAFYRAVGPEPSDTRRFTTTPTSLRSGTKP